MNTYHGTDKYIKWKLIKRSQVMTVLKIMIPEALIGNFPTDYHIILPIAIIEQSGDHWMCLLNEIRPSPLQNLKPGNNP